MLWLICWPILEFGKCFFISIYLKKNELRGGGGGAGGVNGLERFISTPACVIQYTSNKCYTPEMWN